MLKSDFERNALEAESMRKRVQTPQVYFWEGYLRGLRRNFHGQIFGTEYEHGQWLSLKTRLGDDRLRYRGVGYEMGFKGTPMSEATRYAEAIHPEEPKGTERSLGASYLYARRVRGKK